MNVPAADPLRLDPGERTAVESALARVLADGPMVVGPHVESFEHDFGAYVGAPHVVGVGNGSDALVLALLALDLPDGAEVLVPANDGGFAAGAARGAGLVPVATDVDPVTLLVTAETADQACTDRCAAVVVTHLHGNPADVAGLDAWRRGRGLRMVEDCAQAVGLRVDGTHVGSAGDLATYSFYPTKNLGALGDGGAVTSHDAALADAVRQRSRYGWGERFRVDVPGGRNSRLDAIQAAVLSARLPFLDAGNARRHAILEAYAAATPSLDWLVSAESVAHHAVVRVHDRDGVRERLAAAGIASDVHYPWLVTEMPGLEVAPADLPNADAGRRQVLSLPCFPGLTEPEVERVVAALGGADGLA